MRDECIVCDRAVLRPVTHRRDQPLLCAPCQHNLQRKVDHAARLLEHDMVNGPLPLSQSPKQQPWYIPDPYNVIAFFIGILLGTLAHFMGWFR